VRRLVKYEGEARLSDERISILLNPSAGQGKASRLKDRLLRKLREHELLFDLTVTESEMHLKETVRAHAEKYDALVAAGGDSTLHLIVNEIAGKTGDIKIGLIGIGSSNDMTREFGLDSLDAACRALRRMRTRKIDLGLIMEGGMPLRYFIGQANIGLGVFVNRSIAELARFKPRRARRQKLAGVRAILRAYRSQKIPVELNIDSEGRTERGRFQIAVFSNIKYWATGKMISPRAVPDDGLLDGCLIRECSFSRLARISALAGRGRHVGAPEVAVLQASSFEVSGEPPFEIQADGEILKTPDGRTMFPLVTLSTIPRALTFIC
jgi:diacylglycerol kinase (ATP)